MLLLITLISCALAYVVGILPMFIYKTVRSSIMFIGNTIDNIIKPTMKRFVNLTDNIIHKKLVSKTEQAYKSTAETQIGE